MAKQLSVSVNEWVWEAFLQGRKNVSAFIEESVIRNSTNEGKEFETTKHLVELQKKYKILEDEKNMIMAQYMSLKARKSSKILTEQEQIGQCLLKTGFLRDKIMRQ